MATTTCPQCNASYPRVLKTCPSCKEAPSDPPLSSSTIKKFIPLIVTVDLVLISGFLLYFFVLR